MARWSFGATILDTAVGPRDPVGAAHGIADVVQTVSSALVVADVATVDGEVATLVADGASPTQAHVDALNTDWGALKTDWDALLAGLPGVPTTADVVISFDASTVVTRSVLRRAVLRLLEAIEGHSALAP